MKLAELIRGNLLKSATATVATTATDDAEMRASVAPVATVAVANPAETARKWLLHFADRESMTAHYSPAASYDQALASYPGVVAAEPIAETPPRRATEAEAAELARLVAALFAVDTEAERAIALQAALSDVDNALLTFLAMTKAKGLVH